MTILERINELFSSSQSNKAIETPKKDWWEELLNYLKQEGSNNFMPPNQSPIFEKDFENNSIIWQINDNADLNDLDMNEITGFWNESVASLANNEINYFENEDLTIPNTGYITKDDIKNANAGNNFNNGEWVKAWKNINGWTYSKVRDNDSVVSVLNSERNIQFTRSKDKPYLRLIMPKYTRRVEVEDLDRDFWVIGQTITGISAFLFDDKSPIVSLFNSIYNELIQLWENIMYLWTEAALLSKKSYSNIRTFYLPLPNNNLQPYTKYDNFDNDIPNEDTVKKQLAFLIDKYPEDNLCVVPIVRKDNYKKNYYKSEIYPYILILNRNVDEDNFKVISLKTKNNLPPGVKITGSMAKFYSDDYSSKIYALQQNGPKTQLYYPYNNFYSDDNSKLYYGLLRTKLNMNVSLNGNTVQINHIEFNTYDVGQDNYIHSYSFTGGGTENSDSITLQSNFITQSNSPSSSVIKDNFGYYIGEVVSDSTKGLDNISYTFEYNSLGSSATFVKIGNYLPTAVLDKGTIEGHNVRAKLARISPYGSEIRTAIRQDWVPYVTDGTISSDTYYSDTSTYNFYWIRDSVPEDTNENLSTNITLKESCYRRVVDGKDAPVGSTVSKDELLTHFLNIILPTIVLDNKVQYFITEYGAQSPWFNYKGIMYWTNRVMCHLIRYIPGQLAISSSATPIKRNNKIIGYVDIQQELGYIDKAYSSGNFSDPTGTSTTTYRVPYFSCQDSSEAYWNYTKYINGKEASKGYISNSDLNKIYSKASNKETFEVEKVTSSIVNKIENNSQSFIDDFIKADNFSGSIELRNGFDNSTQITVKIDKNGQTTEASQFEQISTIGASSW